MNRKKEEMIKMRPMLVCFACVLAVAGVLIAIIYNNQNFMNPEDYYSRNKGEMEEIAAYFKALYEKESDLVEAKYSADDGKIRLRFGVKDEGDSEVSTRRNDCTEQRITDIMADLRGKYQEREDAPVFHYIEVSYDKNGNMMLFTTVKQKMYYDEGEPFDVERPSGTIFFLVYIDEAYKNDDFSFIKADDVRYMQRPFRKNWYVWSTKGYAG